jgi:hypothetical protein
MNRGIFSLIVVLFFTSYFAGCKSDDASAIVGKWAQEEDQSVVLEFIGDGSGILTEDNIEYKFTWAMEDDRLKIKAENEYVSSFDYKISRSALTLRDDKFIKIKNSNIQK